jgi:hypothetical protein
MRHRSSSIQRTGNRQRFRFENYSLKAKAIKLDKIKTAISFFRTQLKTHQNLLPFQQQFTGPFPGQSLDGEQQGAQMVEAYHRNRVIHQQPWETEEGVIPMFEIHDFLVRFLWKP